MNICDNCKTPKPRRAIKVKDILYGRGIVQYDLCENCFKKIFKPLVDNRAKAGNIK